MKLFITTICMLFALTIAAQNNTAQQYQSVITGIGLPDGSKQEKRSLYVGSAKLLLDLTNKKNETGIGNTEVFYLPKTYTMDSLKLVLQKASWTVSAVAGETNYFILIKSNKQVMAYFSPRKKNCDLYFGEMDKPNITVTTKTDTLQKVNTTNNETKSIIPVNNKTIPAANGYTFTTTNFDDGWVSAVKEDFVEVTKGTIKVLIHYPNKKADAYNSVLKDGDYNAWDVLVAPRYSNLKNFEWKSIQSWESISFIQVDAVENATGKMVHIVLFKKHYSNGNGRYLEFVTNCMADYETEFGAFHKTEFDWEKTADMQFRNKFAVAANDLVGVWTAQDYASLSYYYVSSGGYAGATSTSTADKFTFMSGNNYESDHSGASGVVGNAKFSRQVYKGKCNVNTWQLSLSNRFKGATDNFECLFEAIKGGRILLLCQITEGFKSSYTLVKK